jgi:hypothetical protein
MNWVFFTYYTLVLDKLEDSVFTVCSCSQVMLQKLFLQIFMRAIYCVIYKYLYLQAVCSHLLYIFKNVYSSGVISL